MRHEVVPYVPNAIAEPEAQPQRNDWNSLEIREPARDANMVADVQVPLFQAVITGLLMTLTLVGGVWLSVGELLPVGVTIVLMVGIATAVWTLLLIHNRQMLYKVEVWTGLDINGDGRVGEPESIVLLNRYHGQTQQQVDERSQFERFLRVCEQTGDTSFRTWKGHIPHALYNDWRAKLFAAGYAQWRGGSRNQGWELTRPVDEIVGAIE